MRGRLLPKHENVVNSKALNVLWMVKASWERDEESELLGYANIGKDLDNRISISSECD